jgi:hypothetical protein
LSRENGNDDNILWAYAHIIYSDTQIQLYTKSVDKLVLWKEGSWETLFFFLKPSINFPEGQGVKF